MAASKKEAGGEKDPGTTALISAAGMLLLGAPALGYFYLGNIRKGRIYLLLTWIILGIVLAIYFLGALATGIGFVCLLPIFIIVLAFELLIVYDSYLVAKGEKPKLPEF